MQRWSFVPVLACLLASLTSAQADLGPLVALDAKPGDLFGTSVALSGERALVGAPAHDAASTDDGAA